MLSPRFLSRVPRAVAPILSRGKGTPETRVQLVSSEKENAFVFPFMEKDIKDPAEINKEMGPCFWQMRIGKEG